MKRMELEAIIEEELYNELGGIDEKSVPQPYNRKSPPRRKMTKAQIAKRKKIGDKMKENPKTVARFKKKYGGEWIDYLWASASSIALGGGFKGSGGKRSGSKKKPTAKKTSSAKKSTAKPTGRKRTGIKLTPDQRKNANAMYKQIQRMAKKDGSLDETRLLNYANALEQRFSMLTENHKNFDGRLMTKILHKMVKKLMEKHND